ncbi:Pentatricopeptide repeat-containing protein [Acorus calamus]|uniref:Pentatricopeptide repeat-containing protein n=1 Tax=Acorus calamus TaxID=4465 RepID=A0AAV9DU14_ACOCL|nr:Pentatricopeptide repeat-containing protein [Acorus calamus]
MNRVSRHSYLTSPSRAWSRFKDLLFSGPLEKAFSEFESLRKTFAAEPPPIKLYNSLLKASLKQSRLDLVSSVYKDMILSRVLIETRTLNLLMASLCESGRLGDARRVFDSMSEKGCKPDGASFRVLVSGYCREGLSFRGLELLNEMGRFGCSPDRKIYNAVVSGFCRENKVVEAERLVERMVKGGVFPDEVTFTVRISALCKAGKVLEAYRIFQNMKGTMGDIAEANKTLEEMMRDGCFPSISTCNVLLQSLWKEGRISEAELLLEKMNEKGYSLDKISCNIVIDGLCKSGKLNKAIEIVDGMWLHGSTALGGLGNAFLGLVDNTTNGNKCFPDLVMYSTLIDGLCKAGRLDEAKKKFAEMLVRNIAPDSVIYNTFVYNYCKQGKLSSAFRVFRDMEKKGCNPNTKTYNFLIRGLGKERRIDEIQDLINQMQKRGIPPDVLTYNIQIDSLCEVGRLKEAASLLDEMLRKGITPNVSSFSVLIKGSFRAGDFEAAQEAFEIALTICSQKDVLYGLMCDELCGCGRLSEAKQLFEAAVERGMRVECFPYKSLFEGLCKEEKADGAHSLLNKMVHKGYTFDPAVFMPIIDIFGMRGNKHEVDDLSEKMMRMAARYDQLNVVGSRARNRQSPSKMIQNDKKKYDHGHTEGNSNGLHSDDGSWMAMKVLRRVQSGWGQGSMPSLKMRKPNVLDDWVLEALSLMLRHGNYGAEVVIF